MSQIGALRPQIRKHELELGPNWKYSGTLGFVTTILFFKTTPLFVRGALESTQVHSTAFPRVPGALRPLQELDAEDISIEGLCSRASSDASPALSPMKQPHKPPLNIYHAKP